MEANVYTDRGNLGVSVSAPQPGELEQLAASAAETLVNAMATDAWDTVRDRIGRLLGLTARIDAAAAGAGDGRADRAAQQWELRTRIESVLDTRPEIAGDLRRALADLPSPVTTTRITVRAGADAQVAEGHGRITRFGDVGPRSRIKVNQGDRRFSLRIGPWLFTARQVVTTAAAVVVVAGAGVAVATRDNRPTAGGPPGGASPRSVPATPPAPLKWSVVLAAPAPDTPGLDQLANITSMSCIPPTNCFGLGYAGTNDTSTGDDHIIRFDGHAWTVTNQANTSGVPSPPLPQRIWCSGPTQCVGVTDLHDVTTWITRWNGTAWSTVTVLRGPGADLSGLTSVACSGASSCIAMSGSEPGTLARLVDGHWQADTNAPPPAVSDVTCAAPNDCWAVGPDATQILHIDATSWHTVTAPTPPGTSTGTPGNPLLSSPACAAPTDCWAVGYWYTPETATTPESASGYFLEHYNGQSWTVSTSLDLSDLDSDSSGNWGYYDLTCPAPDDCLMLQTTPDGKIFLSGWDGHQWQAQALPTMPQQIRYTDMQLTCASATHCLVYGTGSLPGEDFSRPILFAGTPTS